VLRAFQRRYPVILARAQLNGFITHQRSHIINTILHRQLANTQKVRHQARHTGWRIDHERWLFGRPHETLQNEPIAQWSLDRILLRKRHGFFRFRLWRCRPWPALFGRHFDFSRLSHHLRQPLDLLVGARFQVDTAGSQRGPIVLAFLSA
jgi:hypothetical protein